MQLCVCTIYLKSRIVTSKIVHSLVSPATGVPEEDDDHTGDSGMGTGSGSAQYLAKDFLPGIYQVCSYYINITHILGKGRGGWNAVY